MSTAPLYQLIDFGGGKKLERIGGLIVERPHPGASQPPLGSPLWQTPDLVFRQDRWKSLTDKAEKLLAEKSFFPLVPPPQNGHSASLAATGKRKNEKTGLSHDVSTRQHDQTDKDLSTAEKASHGAARSLSHGASLGLESDISGAEPGAELGRWEVQQSEIRLGLRPTPAGQVGIFPEHWAHWDWFREKLQERESQNFAPTKILHLFGYTGATTLALAGMGYHVTHVDASKPTVQWARENALRSNLSDRPVRWVVEDAAKFVAREVKRGNQYDAIILDPPSFGHGTKAERWEIQRDLYPLLENCWRLLSSVRSFVLLCGHSSDIRLKDISKALREEFGKEAVGKQATQMAALHSESGGVLDCGYACKFEW